MPAELQPAPPGQPSAPTHERALIQRGADLVYLTEELFLRLFVLTLVLTAIGCALSIWFAVIGSRISLALTCAIAAIALAFAILGLTHPRACYRWLRYSKPRQLSLAAFAILAVLCNVPDSPSWWVALPLLWVLAAVSSTTLATTAATVTAVAYLVGTALGGEPLVHHGDAETLGAAVALPGNVLIGRLVAEVFAWFVLRMHQLERQVEAPSQPRRVRVTTGPATTGSTSTSESTQAQKPRRSPTHLTSRELEALLLVRDGLLHDEIASALGVSTRQVERLLASARSRTGTATTSQLVARLVTYQITP